MPGESYDPDDRVTEEDKLAFILSEIMNDAAPLGWTKYRGAAICLLASDEVNALFAGKSLATLKGAILRYVDSGDDNLAEVLELVGLLSDDGL